MKRAELPPNQMEIKKILRWNIDHPGIVSENPKFDPDKWSLTVNGDVGNPIKWNWKEFLGVQSEESISNFHCVEGWSVKNLKWYGVKFSTLVQIVKPSEEAKYVLFKCSDGYTTDLEMTELLKGNALLAYKLNEELLETPLGGPLRLIVPDKYAYKSAMWIEQITFSRKKELGFWEKRGYSDTADVWKNDRFARRF